MEEFSWKKKLEKLSSKNAIKWGWNRVHESIEIESEYWIKMMANEETRIDLLRWICLGYFKGWLEFILKKEKKKNPSEGNEGKGFAKSRQRKIICKKKCHICIKFLFYYNKKKKRMEIIFYKKNGFNS